MLMNSTSIELQWDLLSMLSLWQANTHACMDTHTHQPARVKNRLHYVLV